MNLLPRIFCVLLVAWSAPASAVLGSAPTTPQTDGAHSKASLRVSSRALFSVHELMLPSGTTVLEYVSPDNQVFALTWQGPFMPNLQELLGAHFDRYRQVAGKTHAGRRPVEVQDPALVIHAGGHPRAFQGHAYLPGSFPPGVTLDDIQ